MTKREDLLAAATPRTLRPHADVKKALVGRRRGRNWLHQLLTVRSEDRARLENLLDKVTRQGVRATKSQIFRAALIALEQQPTTAAAELVKSLRDQ